MFFVILILSPTISSMSLLLSYTSRRFGNLTVIYLVRVDYRIMTSEYQAYLGQCRVMPLCKPYSRGRLAFTGFTSSCKETTSLEKTCLLNAGGMQNRDPFSENTIFCFLTIRGIDRNHNDKLYAIHSALYLDLLKRFLPFYSEWTTWADVRK